MCKRVLPLTVLTAIFAFQHTAASGPWTNEPAGSHTFLDCPFNSLGECHITGPGGAIVTDGTAPVSPSNVAKSSISPGATSGGSELHYYTPQMNKEIFMGLMWRTNSQFQGRTTANKLFFIRGPGNNGFFGLGGSPGDAAGNIYFGHNSGSLDNSHACSYDLGLYCGPNVGSKVVAKGVWAKIEVYIKHSTTVTSRDGIVRWWIDGVMVGNYTNLNYASSGLNEWVWSETWDGTVTNPIPSVEWAHYIDHLYVSAPNFILSLPKITNDTIPKSAISGKPYAAYLKATQGQVPYTWTISSGNLPGGLTLGKGTGVISGVPNTCGLHNFTVMLTDVNKSQTTKTFSINVAGTCTGPLVSAQRPNNGNALLVARMAAGVVTFSLPSNQEGWYQLSLYDLSGKEVYRGSGQGQNEIRIKSALGNGIYLAKLKQGLQLSTVRFNVMN